MSGIGAGCADGVRTIANAEDELMGSFFLGQEVTWKSQSAGYWKEKKGIIVAVVPPNMDPVKFIPDGYQAKGLGFHRDHESYLVRIGNRISLSWPRVSALLRGAGGSVEFVVNIPSLQNRIAELEAKAERKIKVIQDVMNIQCSNGNWNYEEYMMGLANGLILAHHLLTGADGSPPYKSKPDEWLKGKVLLGGPIVQECKPVGEP